MKNQRQILTFLHEAEKLKSVLRHSWLSSGRRESTAEHTWRMALMAMLLHPHLKKKPRLFKTLKMVLMHDLVEVYAGDVAAWKKDRSPKLKSVVIKKEQQAMDKIAKMLPGRQGKEIKSLWVEYERGNTLESRFAKALDRLEVKIQHQEADIKFLKKSEFKYNLIGGKKECEFDPFIQEIWVNLRDEWIKIYKKNKIRKNFYA